MKKIGIFLVGLALFLVACGDDSRSIETSLRYDGDNFNAPLLEPGTFEAAARFPTNVTDNFMGQSLTQVSYYMASTPQQTTLKIYEGGSATVPGTLVYEASLTGTITQNAFNVHVLSEPLEITGEDLWLSISMRTNRPLQMIGCDPGPRDPNGDFLFRSIDNEWTTFQALSGESINWNIRGVVSE
ncbi:MAG: hypothetical protein AAGJ18_02815 [Bacteroidota bacterium]